MQEMNSRENSNNSKKKTLKKLSPRKSPIKINPRAPLQPVKFQLSPSRVINHRRLRGSSITSYSNSRGSSTESHPPPILRRSDIVAHEIDVE